MKPTCPKLTMPELPENDWMARTSVSAIRKFTTTRRSAGLATASATTATIRSGKAARPVPLSEWRRRRLMARPPQQDPPERSDEASSARGECAAPFAVSSTDFRRPDEEALGPEVEDGDDDREREGG